MEFTPIYGLKKPEENEFYNVNDQNYNMDILDPLLNALNTNKVDKVVGKQLSTEDYTTSEKDKLAGIQEGATNYVHPTTHPPSIIVETTTKRFVTDVEKAYWNEKASTALATTIANGLMSSTDKTKLDGIATGANTKIAVGQYTGNNLATRTITVGFTPMLVIILAGNEYDNAIYISSRTVQLNMLHSTGADQVNRIVSNGFTVVTALLRLANLNNSAVTYNYVAIGQ